MKRKPALPARNGACKGKRRYRSAGDALDAAAVLGIERWRKAYLCPECGHWHLTSRILS